MAPQDIPVQPVPASGRGELPPQDRRRSNGGRRQGQARQGEV